MSDIMRPIPFAQLMDWALTEYRQQKSLFGVCKLVRHENGQARPIFGEKIEAPFGPAAGPNTQLAQNIVAAYAAGARFFELKTVQIMDGEALSKCVAKPCITAGDECYNASGPPSSPFPRPMRSTSRHGLPASSWQKSWRWAIRTALFSICPWAMTWRGSRAPRSTPILRA